MPTSHRAKVWRCAGKTMQNCAETSAGIFSKSILTLLVCGTHWIFIYLISSYKHFYFNCYFSETDYQTDCTTQYSQSCRTVYDTRQQCDTQYEEVCNDVPETNCQDVQRQVQETVQEEECRSVDERQCSTVYENQCDTVYDQQCSTVEVKLLLLLSINVMQ